MQKKLSDGLAFLSNQEPAIKLKKLTQLLEKLENSEEKIILLIRQKKEII